MERITILVSYASDTGFNSQTCFQSVVIIMSHRFVLYDALKSLNSGFIMYKFGELSVLHFLEGCPEVSLIADYLIQNDWGYPLDESSTRWILSKKAEKSL